MSQKKTNKWLALCVVSLGSLLSTINASSITIANPILVSSFAINMDQVQWVTSIYLIIVCSTTLLFGKIGDRIGGHKVYVIGLCVFNVGSLCCGLSGSFAMLLASRALQALGVAMWGSNSMGLISTIFPGEQRGTAIGLNAVAVGFGSMLGPSLGGFILSIASWPFLFFFNVPIGVAATVFGLFWLRSPLPPVKDAPPLDIRGAILLVGAISSLVLFISGGFVGSQWFLIGFLGFTPALMLSEKRLKAPLLDFGLFKNPGFFTGNTIAFITYVANTMLVFQLPFFLEYVWHVPVGNAGLLIMVMALCLAVSAPIAGMISDRIGASRVMPAALTVSVIGHIAALLLSETLAIPLFIIFMFLVGVGVGMLNTPNNSQIMTSAGPECSSYASGFVTTTRNMAFCVGTAASAGLFSAVLGFICTGAPSESDQLFAFRFIVSVGLMLYVFALIICLRHKQYAPAQEKLSGLDKHQKAL